MRPHHVPTRVFGGFASALVAKRLGETTVSSEHEFWPADISLLDDEAIDWSFVLGHRQVTDAYLLALATRNGGRLVTFDKRISPDVVPGARTDNLVVIA